MIQPHMVNPIKIFSRGRHQYEMLNEDQSLTPAGQNQKRALSTSRLLPACPPSISTQMHTFLFFFLSFYATERSNLPYLERKQRGPPKTLQDARVPCLVSSC